MINTKKITEGRVNKGGVNDAPTTPDPKGQGKQKWRKTMNTRLISFRLLAKCCLHREEYGWGYGGAECGLDDIPFSEGRSKCASKNCPLMTWGCAMKNKDIKSGIIAAMFVSIVFCVTFVLSSISVGRANRNIIIAEEVKHESGGQ
jgi:hypothetical protein